MQPSVGSCLMAFMVVSVPRRTLLERGALCVAYLMFSPVGFAQDEASRKPRALGGRSYAVRGVVEAIGDDHLTIMRTTRKHERLEFTLDAQTAREGDVTVGQVVSVRYRAGDAGYVATAVAARNRRKQQPRGSVSAGQNGSVRP